jgi:pimeloyl-ACP methyl ester carboxylesterase
LVSAALVPVLCKIALVPGAFGAGTSSLFLDPNDYFKEYEAYFRAKGCAVSRVVFPEDATIEVRAMFLRDQIERMAKVSDGNWTLVAHSQGGLDARFALKTLKMKGASALVTVGTPHEGTPLANWAARQRDSGGLSYWFLKLLGGYDLRGLSFLGEMTGEFLGKHRDKFEAVPGVRYASARGVCRTLCARSVRLLAWWTKLPAGDGIVPGDNQKFGDDLGELDLDHISEAGADSGKAAERKRFLDSVWTWLRPSGSKAPRSAR